MIKVLADKVGEKEAAILEGHILLMSDPALIDEISWDRSFLNCTK